MKSPFGALILAAKKPGTPMPETGQDEGADDSDAGGKAAAQDLIDAIASKDAGAVWEAIESLHTLCNKYDDKE